MRPSQWLVSTILMAVAVSGCGHQGGQSAPEKSTLRVGFISSAGGDPQGPEGWAYKQGLLQPALKDAGITSVKFTAFGNGPDLNEAMAGHAIDVGILGDTPAIVGHAAGMPTRLINQSTYGTNCWLIVRPDGPKSVDDLRGKTVATQKGSYMARYLLGLLDEKGLTKSVKFVHLASTDSEPALRRGDVDAVASGSGPILISHGLKSIDEASQHPKLLGSSLTVATTAFLADHPNFPAVWNRVRSVGVENLEKHEDQYNAWQAARVKLDVATYKALYPSRSYLEVPLTSKGVTLLDGTKAFLVEQHLAKSDFKISDWTVPGVYPTSRISVASAH
jgi:sulfonate transport system substrate-binding protein